jgi:hypothetical protein
MARALIDAARQSVFGGLDFVGCCVCGRPAAAAFSIDGFAAAIAFDIHFQDRGMMDEAVDGRERHGLVGEDFAPFAERLVGRYQHGPPLVACGNQLEQHAGFGLILGDVSEVIKDEQIVAIEPGDRMFEGQVATGDLELLDEIGCPALGRQLQAD